MSIVDDIAEEHLQSQRTARTDSTREYRASIRDRTAERNSKYYRNNRWVMVYGMENHRKDSIAYKEDVLNLPEERLCGPEEAELVIDDDPYMDPVVVCDRRATRSIVAERLARAAASTYNGTHKGGRDVEMLRLLFGFYDNREWTLGEVGRRFGVSSMRVSQIEARVIKRLKWMYYAGDEHQVMLSDWPNIPAGWDFSLEVTDIPQWL